MILLALIYALVLIIYWLHASRIEPENYPKLDAELVLHWRAVKLNNCRRFAGLFLIYVVVFFVASLLAGYAARHQVHWLLYFTAYTELAYILFCIGVIIWSSIKTRRYGRQIGVIS